MNSSKRVAVMVALLMASVVAYASIATGNRTILLSRNVLRTTAPRAFVTSAIDNVYRELRLDQ